MKSEILYILLCNMYVICIMCYEDLCMYMCICVFIYMVEHNMWVWVGNFNIRGNIYNVQTYFYILHISNSEWIVNSAEIHCDLINFIFLIIFIYILHIMLFSIWDFDIYFLVYLFPFTLIQSLQFLLAHTSFLKKCFQLSLKIQFCCKYHKLWHI